MKKNISQDSYEKTEKKGLQVPYATRKTMMSSVRIQVTSTHKIEEMFPSGQLGKKKQKGLQLQ
jgi:hypothetical protein